MSKAFALEVMKHPNQVKELIELFFSDDLRICQMASFPVITLADSDIALFEPYLERIVNNYHRAPHDAFRRNAIRILQFIDIPEELQGRIYDLCLSEFCDIKKPTAIRVFSITVLVNICNQHPSLKEELMSILSDYQRTGTIGFENRLQKEIKRLMAIKDDY